MNIEHQFVYLSTLIVPADWFAAAGNTCRLPFILIHPHGEPFQLFVWICFHWRCTWNPKLQHHMSVFPIYASVSLLEHWCWGPGGMSYFFSSLMIHLNCCANSFTKYFLPSFDQAWWHHSQLIPFTLIIVFSFNAEYLMFSDVNFFNSVATILGSVFQHNGKIYIW